MSQCEYDSLSPLPDRKMLEGDHLFSLGLDHRIGQVKVWETVSNEAWQALASFIAQLPALSDLVYNCASAVPPCILDALDQTGCRLHVNTFRVPALKTALDADFIQLITSSSLSSIRAAYLPTASGLAVSGLDTELIYEEDTLRRIVAESATNLKSVTIIRKARGVDPSIASPPPCPEYKLAGLRLPRFQRGSLHELALLHQHVVSASDIESWQAHIDFWVLVVLRISARISLDALNVLSSVDLPSLESLSLTVHKSSGSTDIITAVNHFLLAVRPVRKLCLEKTIQTLSLVQVVEHHGSTLRRLCLLPSKEYTACNTQWSDHYLPSATILSAITRSCPLIEDLAITVRRSKGSSEEVQMYRVLGSLPKLQSLSLTLDASDYSLLWSFEAFTNNLGGATRNWPPPPDDKSFDDFERDLYPQVFIGGGPVVRNGHVRDAFINCAVDKRLALAIFNAICYSGQGNRSRLRNLTLNTIGGGSFTPYTDLPSSLATVVGEISHSWKITRNSSSEGDIISIKETDKTPREQRISNIWRQRDLEEPALSIFRSLWPATEAQDWRQEWRSFPLVSIDDLQDV